MDNKHEEWLRQADYDMGILPMRCMKAGVVSMQFSCVICPLRKL